jgi:predicted Zn-dependent protease
MSDKIGERIMSPMITIVDDAMADNAIGLTFDFEGQPKKRVELIKDGVANAVVTDSYWAAKTESENTGHALPAPNAHGPMPLNLRMEPGNATIDELVSSVKRGIYVTRFHYVNVEEPIPVTLTGMTRDGTFMIEDGQLSRPLKNQRFTQSVIEAFSNVRGITTERQYSGSEFLGHAFVPGMLLESFAFTGQTG